jgi:uncharacterized membrane protein YkvA (DUF1232 family)
MKKQPFATAFHSFYRQALKHSKYRWVVILGTLLYLVSPLDISPDVFPIIGWIDDGIVISLLMTEVSQIMSEQLKRKRQINTQTSADTATRDSAQTITVEAVSVS